MRHRGGWYRWAARAVKTTYPSLARKPMGQATQRAARIKALQPMCVGPAPFNGESGAVVLIGKNSPDAKQRMLCAVADVVRPIEVVRAIEGLVQQSQTEVGWIVVTYAPEGGVSFQQLVDLHEAIECEIGWLGEGYAARKLKWSALVFGLPKDVEAIRPLLLKFSEDVLDASDTRDMPVMAMMQGFDPKLHFQVPSEDVYSMNLAPALRLFDSFAADIRRVEKLAGSLVITFSGFDEDDRFLGEIPAVDAYLRQLLFFAPWAPLVLDTSSFLLWVKALDSRAEILTSAEGTTVVKVPPIVSNSIMESFKWTLAEFVAGRLLVKEMPPSLRATVLEWNSFLNTGPEPVPFPESPI